MKICTQTYTYHFFPTILSWTSAVNKERNYLQPCISWQEHFQKKTQQPMFKRSVTRSCFNLHTFFWHLELSYQTGLSQAMYTFVCVCKQCALKSPIVNYFPVKIRGWALQGVYCMARVNIGYKNNQQHPKVKLSELQHPSSSTSAVSPALPTNLSHGLTHLQQVVADSSHIYNAKPFQLCILNHPPVTIFIGGGRVTSSHRW